MQQLKKQPWLKVADPSCKGKRKNARKNSFRTICCNMPVPCLFQQQSSQLTLCITCVYRYMCMHVCMYVCLHACVFICICARVCLRFHAAWSLTTPPISLPCWISLLQTVKMSCFISPATWNQDGNEAKTRSISSLKDENANRFERNIRTKCKTFDANTLARSAQPPESPTWYARRNTEWTCNRNKKHLEHDAKTLNKKS